MFFAKAGYSVDSCSKGIWITAEDNAFGYVVLSLREKSMLSLHCFRLSFSAGVAFLAYQGEAGGDKVSLSIFFLVLIEK